MISPNKLIGSLVYRTRAALNGNQAFKKELAQYTYSPNCLVDDEFLFWHYPGTHNEISRNLLEIGKHVNGSRVKFPAILNFQAIRQEKSGEDVKLVYNLAIVGSVLSEWTTEQREVQVFDRLLRPIYVEFMSQIQKAGYFHLNYGNPPHTYYEIFTTGNDERIMNRYGEFVDAIELHNLTLKLRVNLCKRDYARIETENALVTKDINNLLKLL